MFTSTGQMGRLRRRRYTHNSILHAAAWVAILLLASVTRLYAPDWDGGIAAHPDERYLIGVGQSTMLYANPCEAEPYFAYGHLPVYLVQIATWTAPGADPLYVMRLASGLVGVLLVAVTGATAHALAGKRAALLAATITMLSPFLIQQAHFYTVDPLAALFASLSILMAIRHRWRWAAMFCGFAAATKVTLLLTGISLILGLIRERRSMEARWRDLIRRVAQVIFAAVGSWLVAAPWMFDPSLECWRGPIYQARIMSGQIAVPYTLQYVDTAPFLYPLLQMALWGLGPAVVLIGICAVCGMGARLRTLSQGRALAWIWLVSYFVAIGGQYAKFPRYMLPIYPVWAASAACILVGWTQAARKWKRVVGYAVISVIVVSGLVMGSAQISVYVAEHPWCSASRWISTNVPAQARIVIEEWDHPLPVPLPDSNEIPAQVTWPVYDPHALETPELAMMIESADTYVIATRRAYASLSRWPVTYETTLAWYSRLLKAPDIMTFSRCPSIGPVAITDDPVRDSGLSTGRSLAELCGKRYAIRLPRLDESYRVYDAPIVLIVALR